MYIFVMYNTEMFDTNFKYYVIRILNKWMMSHLNYSDSIVSTIDYLYVYGVDVMIAWLYNIVSSHLKH